MLARTVGKFSQIRLQGLFQGGVRLSSQASTALKAPSATEKPVSYMSDAVFVNSLSGTRTLELRRSADGNMLDNETCAAVIRVLERFEENDVVQSILFSSEDPDLFSLTLSNDKDSLKELHNMIRAVNTSTKDTVVMYGGAMTSTAYAAFAGSKYKLGSCTMKLKMSELQEGKLPTAGVAHYFAKSYSDNGGAAMARYLAVSGREVRADELFKMGLLTHLVEEGAQDSLTHALAHTHPSTDDLAEVNNRNGVIRQQSISGLLEMMHIESDMNVLGSEFWNQYVLVPPGRWDTLAKEDAGIDDTLEDLEIIHDQIALCFDPKERSVEGTKELLRAVGKPWARHALECMDALDTDRMQQWWELTVFATDAKMSLDDVLAKEQELL